MILVTAFIMLGISTLGGAALWGGHALREKRRQANYRRWRSQWHLIKGGLEDGHCE